MQITQEQFNELVFFALQVHSAKLQSRDWVSGSYERIDSSGRSHSNQARLTDMREIFASGLFCARFHWVESTSITNHLYQRFEHHSQYAKQLFNNIEKIAGDAWNSGTWPSFLDCLSISAKTSDDLKNDKDQVPTSMLPTVFDGPHTGGLSEKEYLDAYKDYKPRIINKLNEYFQCNYDYTYLGNDKPWIIRHFLEIYVPEILSTIVTTSALYYFNPLSIFAKVIAINFPSWLTGSDISYIAAFKLLEQTPFSTGEPEYVFNPHRHVKIWLSKNKDQFLNQENQLRLVKMRADNPEDEINLVYSGQLLSEQARQDLELFCKKHKINPVCIEEDVIPKCKNNVNEQKLVKLYQDEINSLAYEGNLAAASDILRWLSPVYSLGTYSDLDVSVKTKKAPLGKVVSSPLLLNIGSIKCTDKLEALFYNNDRISIVDPKSAAKQIEKIQETIINNCESDQCFQSAIDRIQKISQTVTGENVLTSEELFLSVLNYIKTNYQIKNMPHLRSVIQDLTNTKDSCIELFTRSGGNLIIPDNESKLETLKALKNMQENLLKYCVMYTTGPMILHNLFDKPVMSSHEIEKDVSSYTYENNKLSSCFSSGNAIKLHSPPNISEMQGKLGETNDASWLPSGGEHVQLREENLHQKARVIQKHFKKTMQNRETEKNETESINKNSPKSTN